MTGDGGEHDDGDGAQPLRRRRRVPWWAKGGPRFRDRLCFWADPRRGPVTAADARHYRGELKALLRHRHWIARTARKRLALARKAPPVAFRTRTVREWRRPGRRGA